MGELEELLLFLVQLVGPALARHMLSKLVADARNGELEPRPLCREPFDAFDCDELGIYEEE